MHVTIRDSACWYDNLFKSQRRSKSAAPCVVEYSSVVLEYHTAVPCSSTVVVSYLVLEYGGTGTAVLWAQRTTPLNRTTPAHNSSSSTSVNGTSTAAQVRSTNTTTAVRSLGIASSKGHGARTQ